jgi:predicted nuclease of predicted toxin-antitoxin system
MKFLVDECLSPKLVEMARQRGHLESSHIAWLGQSGLQDWNLVTFAVDGNWTLVTKNSYDFRGPAAAPGTGGLYVGVGLHPGLVCLNGDNMDRQMQLDLFAAALDDIEADGDLVNIGLEATLLESGEVDIERYSLPEEPAP